MTDVSYTAWDDKQYQWPPPEGWYQAADGKWWPEGYGPPVAEEAAASVDFAEETAAPLDGVAADTDSEESADFEMETALSAHDSGSSYGAESSYEAGVGYAAATGYESSDVGAQTAVADTHGVADTDAAADTHSAADTVSTEFDDPAGSDAGLAGWAEPSNGAYDAIESTVDTEPTNGSVETGSMETANFEPPSSDDAGFDDGAHSDDATFDDAQSDDTPVDDVSLETDGGAALNETSEFEPISDAPGSLDQVDDSAETELDRLDDLQRQAETQTFGELQAEAADGQLPPLDPTQTLDIDPSELNLESNPYYGSPAVTTAVEPPSEAPYDTIGAVPPDQVDQFDSTTHPDLSRSPILTPASTPPPKSGSGRRLLYVVLGVLALLAAGIAGYLLFQLQDDGESDATAATTGGDTQVVVDTGELGSLSRPHDLAKGIRINYPTEDGDQAWVLEVLEPATATEDEVAANLRLRNDSTTRSVSLSELRFKLVTADGATVIDANDSCSAGSELDMQAVIDPGGQLSGAVCWTATSEQATGALLGVESTKVNGRVYVRLS